MKVIKKGFINNNKEYVLEIKSENEIKKINKNFKLQKQDELIKNKTQNIFTSEIGPKNKKYRIIIFLSFILAIIIIILMIYKFKI